MITDQSQSSQETDELLMDPRQPVFSVVITTRDKPVEFSRALESVCTQAFDSVEILVVNDSSDEQFRTDYANVIAAKGTGSNVRHIELGPRVTGHGPGFARNTGVGLARGQYVCFLDDDDYWSDVNHLADTHSAIEHIRGPVDLMFADQRVDDASDYASGAAAIWTEYLREKDFPAVADSSHSYGVSPDDLAEQDRFAHLNTMCFRRQFYVDLGGYDETQRYEGDRKLFIRAIDQAEHIRYRPVFVAVHKVPDKNLSNNVTTQISTRRKRLAQLRLYQECLSECGHPKIRKMCRRGACYSHQHLTELLLEEGRRQEALTHAVAAVAYKPSIKWAGYTLFLALRAFPSMFRSS